MGSERTPAYQHGGDVAGATRQFVGAHPVALFPRFQADFKLEDGDGVVLDGGFEETLKPEFVRTYKGDVPRIPHGLPKVTGVESPGRSRVVQE